MQGRSQISSVDNRYKFTGKERDAETNYDYFGARYYDARIARWLQVDPLADKYPGWSPYNYCLNNPLIYVDPDGRETLKYLVKTVKGIWRYVNRATAIKKLSKGESTFTKGAGSSQGAKKLLKDTYPEGKKTIRHDGHELEDGTTGMDHHQPTSRTGIDKKKKSHSFYSGVILFIGDLVNDFLTPLEGNEMKPGFGNPGEDIDNDGIPDNQDEINNSKTDDNPDNSKETDKEDIPEDMNNQNSDRRDK